MSPPQVRRGARLLAAFLLLTLPLVPSTAVAVASCSEVAGTATVTMASGDTATLAVSGTDITMNGANCGTTDTVDSIVVNGSSGTQTVNLSLAGGPFAPGATPEATGTSEIEITLSMGSGTDVLNITGSPDADTISLGSLGVNLNADDDADLTTESTETFMVDAGEGNDVVSGLGGDDTGAPFASAITLNGEGGADSLTGGVASDSITGGDGADFLLGEAGNDTILGGPGDDNVGGLAGNDTLVGGAGTDTALYAFADKGVTVNLATSASSGGAGSDTLSGLENVTGSPFDDTVFGNDSPNVLDGGPGSDLLRGGGGADALIGGDGIDTVSYDQATAGVTANLETGATGGGAAGNTISAVENVTGSDFDDTITGDAWDNDLHGGAGDDTLAGGDGNDVVEGGAGNDVLDEGGTANGSDELSGGDGTDTVVYEARVADLTVSLNGGFDDGAAGEGDDIDDDIETVLTGSGNDFIVGDADGRRLDGGPGDDLLIGASGDDILVGGPGIDTADYQTITTGVRVDLGAGQATGGSGNDTLEGIENILGSSGSDVLVGDLGPNELIGGPGDDDLAGARGRDRLSGGSGDDELRGLKGNDVLLGKAGNDLLLGGPKKDRLDGGPGFDECKGGPGPDRVLRCNEKVTVADLI